MKPGSLFLVPVLFFVVLSGLLSAQDAEESEKHDVTRVAVCPIDNKGQNKKLEHYAAGITNILNLRLPSLSGVCNYFHGEIKDQITILKDNGNIDQNAILTRSDARALAKRIAAHRVIYGSFSGTTDRLKVDLRIQIFHPDTGKAGKEMTLLKQTTNAEELLNIWKPVGEGIIRTLKEKPSKNQKNILTQKPTDRKKAYEYFLKGLKKEKSADSPHIESYNKAIEIDPLFKEAYLKRGDAKIRQGDLNGAIKDVNKVIEINPGYTVAYSFRGYAKGYQGDHKRAINDYTKAIEINPGYAKAYMNRGSFKKKQGNLKAAIKDYSKALQINPRFKMAYYNRGVGRIDQGDLQGAISDYTKALEINPRYARAYYNRGNVRHKQGEYKAAIKDYNKALTVAPKNWPHRGRVQEMIDKAKKMMEK